MKIKICSYCKEEYDSKNSRSKYCSLKCTGAASDLHWKKKREQKFLYGKNLEFLRQYSIQNQVCEICKNPETIKFKGTVRRLSYDHDHETGMFRGMLCMVCNTRLEWYIDNREDIEKYLNKNMGL